jgi:hypothetical protein
MNIRVGSRVVFLLILLGLCILIIPVVHAEPAVDPNSGLGIIKGFVDEGLESTIKFQYNSEKWENSGDFAPDAGFATTNYLRAKDSLNEEYSGKKKDSHYWSRMEGLQEKLKDKYAVLRDTEKDPVKQREYLKEMDLASLNQQNSQNRYEEAYEAETGRRSATSLCLIATATFGSPQAREVQLVRDYRDVTIRQSYSGSQFVIGFNAWYYSFSPAVASYISTHPIAKSVMQICLIPLLQIILLSQNISALMNFSPEAATVTVLVFGASMFGLIYLFPLIFLVLAITGRRGVKIPSVGSMRPVLILWTALLALMSMGVFFSLDLLTITSSCLLVMVTVILTAGFASLGLYSYTCTRTKPAAG